MERRKGRGRRVLWTAAKVVIVAVALFFVGKVLVDNWPDVRAGWRAPRAGPAAAAVVVLVASYFLLYKISLAVLRRVGYKLSFRAGGRPFFFTLLGRYIPGRFAVVVGKVYLYERRGVPRVPAALAVVYENVFAAIGGVAVALVASATLLSGMFSWRSLALTAAGALVLAALVQPAVLRRLLGGAFRRARLGDLDPRTLMTPGPATAFALSYGGYCVLLGVFFAFFATAFVPLDYGAAFGAGAAYVVAAVLGYVAVFAPSGLGVREGLLVILLQRYMSPGEAAFLAVASRLVAVAAEIALAGGAAAAGDNSSARDVRG